MQGHAYDNFLVSSFFIGFGIRECNYICSSQAHCQKNTVSGITFCHVKYDEQPMQKKQALNSSGCVHKNCNVALKSVCEEQKCDLTCKDIINLSNESLTQDGGLQCTSSAEAGKHQKHTGRAQA